MSKILYYGIMTLFVLSMVLIFSFSYFFDQNILNIDKKIELTSVFGNRIYLSNIEQPYALHFFASWCHSCNIDHFVFLKYENIFPVYAVAYMDESEKVIKYLNKYKNPYLDIINDTLGNLGKYFAISGLPETLIINNNKVVEHIKGPIKNEEFKMKMVSLFKRA